MDLVPWTLLMVCLVWTGCGGEDTAPPAQGLNVRNRMGENALAEHRYEEALRVFKQALEEGEDAYRSHWNLGRTYVLLNRYEDAERHLRAALAADSLQADAYDALGFLMLRRMGATPTASVLEEGIWAAERAVCLAPENPGFLFHLGVLYIQQDQTDDAIRVLERSIALRGAPAGAYTQLGRLYEVRGEVERALALYQQAAEMEPLSLPRSDDAEVFERLGTVYLKLRRYDDAIQAYQYVLTLDSTRTETYLNLGRAYGQAGRTAEAERMLSMFRARRAEDVADLIVAVEASPDDPQLWVRLARAYKRDGHRSRAEHAYRKTLALDNMQMDAVCELAALLLGEERAVEAESLLTAARRRVPAHPKAAYYLGRVHLHQHHYEAARRALSGAVRYDPTDAAAHHQLGIAWAKQGHFDQAVEALHNALSLDSTAAVLLDLASLELQRGRAQEAIAAARAAERRQPDDWRIYAYLGGAYERLGDLSSARRMNAQAARLKALMQARGGRIAPR